LGDWGEAPDLLLVVAYGRLLPQWLLDWPGRGCINIHASLLPRWRGAAPVQHALLAGDRRTGVSIMQIAAALDEGPVYARRATDIEEQETAGDLGARLARLGAELLGDVLPDILAGRLRAEPQPSEGVSYARKIGKADAALDWTAPALDLARRVRAFNPWPVAESRLSDGRRLRIWEARPLEREAGAAPGVIEAAGPEGIDVATGRGTLRLRRVQPPSAKAMDASAYLAAHSVEGLRFVC
jgi:methionyl-tRNA formyltransferase